MYTTSESARTGRASDSTSRVTVAMRTSLLGACRSLRSSPRRPVRASRGLLPLEQPAEEPPALVRERDRQPEHLGGGGGRARPRRPPPRLGPAALQAPWRRAARIRG